MRAPPDSRSRRCGAARRRDVAPRPRRRLLHAGRGAFLASPSCAPRVDRRRSRPSSRIAPRPRLYEVPGARARSDRDHVRSLGPFDKSRTRSCTSSADSGLRMTSCEVDGIPVVTPELLVLQLAWWKPSPHYVEAVIHALRRKRLISYASTHATFLRHARRGLRGVAATRTALEWWNPDNAATASEMETLLFQTFRAHDLPEPVLQYEIYDRNGLFVARADAGLPAMEGRRRVPVDAGAPRRVPERARRPPAQQDHGRGYWPLIGTHRLTSEPEVTSSSRRSSRLRPSNHRTGVRSVRWAIR